MGRCKCGIDTGWGRGSECSECENMHNNFILGGKVKVVCGFAIGQIGKIINSREETIPYRDEWEGCGHLDYRTQQYFTIKNKNGIFEVKKQDIIKIIKEKV